MRLNIALSRMALVLACLPLATLHAEESAAPTPELEPVTSLVTHKLFLRSGYGPDETRLGEDRRSFGGHADILAMRKSVAREILCRSISSEFGGALARGAGVWARAMRWR